MLSRACFIVKDARVRRSLFLSLGSFCLYTFEFILLPIRMRVLLYLSLNLLKGCEGFLR